MSISTYRPTESAAMSPSPADAPESHGLDALSQLFARLELKAKGLAQMLVLESPWGIAMPPAYREFAMYSVRQGSCVLQRADGTVPIELKAGDAALILKEVPHTVHDGSGANLRQLTYWLGRREAGCAAKPHSEKSESATWLIAESFTLKGSLGCTFAGALGTCVVLRAEQSHGSRHEHLFAMLCQESRVARPGAGFVYSRLMELFFVEFLRECADKLWQDGRSNVLRVLFDAQMLKAMELVHQDPGHDWTLESLAKAAGMSRTAFAVRFKALSGMTPLAYVTQWRMAKAEGLLGNGHTLGEVAAQVGYESEAAFSRAFKRLTGTAPGAARRRRTASNGK